MNIQSPACARPRWPTACGAVILTALFALLPWRSFAQQPAATLPGSTLSRVSLSDLDVSSPRGLRQARERLQIMAERVCADREGDGEASSVGREPSGGEASSQPGFGPCVENTVSSALRRIEAFSHRSNVAVRSSMTLAHGVSLADLDLKTAEGARIARQRLESMARRVCAELAARGDLTYRPDSAACLHDTFAGALAQAEAIAAARIN